MKLSTLIMIGLLAVVAYFIVNDSLKRAAAKKQAESQRENLEILRFHEEESRRRNAESAGSPMAGGAAVKMGKADLYAVRGVVIASGQNGLTVSCDTVSALAHWVAPAGAGAADTARMAKLAEQQDDKTYGPLMLKSTGGSLRPAGWEPAKRASGTIALQGMPAMVKGSKVCVIAAPVGGATFTVNYQLTAEAATSWMWGHSALDR